MAYTNSRLADYTILSPEHSGMRTHCIDRITPHCVVGQLSAKGISGCFSKGTGASCNYAIGHDGSVCLVVDEKNRSWCTSSASNDQRAVTIEVASDKTPPYAFTLEAYNKLVVLCADICKRNGISKVLWFNDKEKSLSYEPKEGECVLTVHRWFANKSCPGDWLYSRMGKLAESINKKLSSSDTGKGKEDKNTVYRVICGSYEKKDNADKLLARLDENGIDAYISNTENLYNVIAGSFSIKENAENHADIVRLNGFGCFVTAAKMPFNAVKPLRSVKEVAIEIINGDCSDERWSTWGIGNTRKNRLKIAGYDYDKVQEEVNKMLK